MVSAPPPWKVVTESERCLRRDVFVVLAGEAAVLVEGGGCGPSTGGFGVETGAGAGASGASSEGLVSCSLVEGGGSLTAAVGVSSSEGLCIRIGGGGTGF